MIDGPIPGIHPRHQTTDWLLRNESVCIRTLPPSLKVYLSRLPIPFCASRLLKAPFVSGGMRRNPPNFATPARPPLSSSTALARQQAPDILPLKIITPSC